MLQNLKKKFAKIALTVMALQLALVGLGAGATGAYAAVDDIAPTANVLHDVDTKTITYSFSESVELRNNDNSVAVLTPDKLAIYTVDSLGNYDLTTKTTNTIDSATINADSTKIVVVYTGSLVTKLNTNYVVDAWGYRITDIAGNKLSPSELQIFMVNGDDIAPTANVLHDVDTKTITYSFSESVELRNNDDSVAVLTPDKLAIYTVDSLGNYDLTTKTTNTIDSATINADSTKIVVVYTGSLVTKLNTNYVVDAWGYRITDIAGNKLAASLEQVFTVEGDNVAPIITTTVTPVVTNTKGEIVVTLTANEAVIIDSLTYTVDDVLYTPTLIPVMSPVGLGLSHTLTFPANFFGVAKSEVVINYIATDLVGNETKVPSVKLAVDSEAPLAVTNLTKTIDAAGHVTLSWKNPEAGTYSTLRVVRVGDFTFSLDPTATTYTDLTTEQGKSYTYVIVVADEAGNETKTTPLLVEVPAAVVAAAVSDTYTYVPEEPKEEVKAQTVEEDDSDVIVDDNKEGLPVWGIILLVILAAVGGYLIWNQKPIQEVAPVVASKKKKTNTKKK